MRAIKVVSVLVCVGVVSLEAVARADEADEASVVPTAAVIHTGLGV